VSSAGAERRFLVAPSLAAGYESPHLVTDGAGATLASYVYAGEHALARYEASGPTYYLRDAMGSVIALADESGARVARLDYDAFGNVRGSAGSASGLPVETAGDFRYHGMWMDPTGLYYVRARSYDPVTGRFVSKDPAEQAPLLPEESHPYAFNANVPTVKRDPEGRFSLAELNFAQAVQKVLSFAQTFARNYARNELRNQVNQIPGNLAASALQQIVPTSSVSNRHGLTRGSTGFSPGEVFEQVMQNTVCLFLNQFDVGAFDYLYWEVPIDQADGKPQGNGFSCSQAEPRSASSGRARRGSLFPRRGGSRGRSFMDFVVSPFPPSTLDSSISGGLRGERAFLGGDIKLSMAAIGSGSQFTSFMKFARDYSYPPIFAFLLLRGGTQAEQTALARRALPYRVYPVVISVL
jgi:RHS repeat-associated protein